MGEAEKETEECEKTPISRPPPPFPQRLKKKSDDWMFNKFLDMPSQIKFNLPVDDVLREIPKYAKYIKYIVANKRRLTLFETVALTEECTSGIQRKLLQKEEKLLRMLREHTRAIGWTMADILDFDECLTNLSKVLARCDETNLVLNWEKCHFMVREGIVLRHKVSKDGLELDKAKVDAIEKLPPPISVK
uniref:Uncharacterized protein LOC104248693 n=1 Tax=Nicotiana sylvestris TaxID=4096 RepID=A0A1U7YGQ9_NICSY|nr:PREDICTED: uncharacterized protein LOC104248693 [Nicotiana sylvestris]